MFTRVEPIMQPRSKNVVMRFLLLGWIIPFSFGVFVYYGFSSNYTISYFSESNFRKSYENGLYKYRVLGRAAVLGTYDLIEIYHLPSMGPKALKFHDPNASPALYTAYFLVNTFFFCLACSALFLAIHRLCPQPFTWINDVALLLMALLMAITQYVVVPYDMLSYFCLAAAIWIMLQFRLGALRLLLLCAALIAGTLTRETTLLIVAFYVGIYHQEIFQKPRAGKLRSEQKDLIALFACFAATYGLLRVYYGTEHGAYQQITIGGFLTFAPDVLGLIFSVAMIVVLTMGHAGRREALWFMLAASPYLLAIIIVASPWETRLVCPIFIGLIVIKLRNGSTTGTIDR